MAAIPPPPPPMVPRGEQLKVWRDQRHKAYLDKIYQERNGRSRRGLWVLIFWILVMGAWIMI